MNFLKKSLVKSLSFAIHPQLDENKKIAIQIASFDGIASVISISLYLFGISSGLFTLHFLHITTITFCLFGLWLLKRHHYNAGRFIIFYAGLAEIYFCLDAVAVSSGMEFYYFPSLIVPFVVFTPDEVRKSIALSMSALCLYVFQQLIGPGHFSAISEVSHSERIITIAILFTYVFGLFSVSRWQMNRAQKKIESQQSELIHISNIAALGEMSGGIAHEINNPLQILSTQLSFLKKQLLLIPEVPVKIIDQTTVMENTILRISKLVKGLKNLSRNIASDPPTIFPVSFAIDDMLAVSAQKLKHMEIELTISGELDLEIKGHMVQLSQVLINLLNNSVDAIDDVTKDKWITLNVTKRNGTIYISVTDSGSGIPKEVANKIMHPFFTTKAPGRGTGLGLSISNGMMEKIGGKLYLDQSSVNTKFVIELPEVNSATKLKV